MTRAPGIRTPPWPVALGILVAAALLGGCAGLGGTSPETAFESSPEAVELADVPWHPQDALQCGPAALAEVLGWTGVSITPADLEPRLFIPAREGTLQTELVAQARHQGRAVHLLDGSLDAILHELHAGNPVLVFQNLGLGWAPVWHYAVVVGYAPEDTAFILRSGPHERHLSPLATFERTWNRADRWAIVVTRPDVIPATATPISWLRSAADLEQTSRRQAAREAYLAGRERWPGEVGFHLGLVNLLYSAGELTRAEDAARDGLAQAQSGQGMLYNNLAQILARQLRWDEAEEAARSAVDAGGRFQATFERTLEEIRCRCLGKR